MIYEGLSSVAVESRKFTGCFSGWIWKGLPSTFTFIFTLSYFFSALCTPLLPVFLPTFRPFSSLLTLFLQSTVCCSAQSRFYKCSWLTILCRDKWLKILPGCFFRILLSLFNVWQSFIIFPYLQVCFFFQSRVGPDCFPCSYCKVQSFLLSSHSWS